ncbi:UNVERIFIED_CONTAM: putative protein phosphatase 2C 23 [Sesamum radiatum]|uniref:PPM-type phosphatase domain-containing protein n=1 Tax=Sesamum radiatum TaxID=300843 RepID=A0AAW2R4Q1_SESRA
MGNGIGKLSLCFAGDAGDISRRRNDIAVCLSDPLDEGFGHSFCYIPPDPVRKSQSLDDSSSAAPQTTVFRTISGAAISANTSTLLSTDLLAYNNSTSLDKASAFESSNFFSSIPLQPIPRNSIHTVKSGPILRNSVPGSGPMERGFMSGPIERSFISGPLDNQIDQLQSGNSSTITSHTLSSEMSLVDENDDVGNESFGSQNLQWAQGKAGEDRVHVVISEEHGWVFVGIYDGFNGPDATDFLLNNLYSNVYKELKGLLWCDKTESCENTINSSSLSSKSLDSKERVELDKKLREKLSYLGPDGFADNTTTINHLGVLKALSEALRKTEAAYLEIADMMLTENPVLALMGSCVLVMVMKGDDVYLMNVGDSRAVLAKKTENDSQVGKTRKDYEESLYGYEYENVHTLTSHQLTMDHSTSVKEEVRKIRNAHPDDASAVINDRVKGSLKVTRAFGAGFLKQNFLSLDRWIYIVICFACVSAQMEQCSSRDVQNRLRWNFPIHHMLPVPLPPQIRTRGNFLILSSDGLYQYFTNEEAVAEVETFMLTFPEEIPPNILLKKCYFVLPRKLEWISMNCLISHKGIEGGTMTMSRLLSFPLKEEYGVHPCN